MEAGSGCGQPEQPGIYSIQVNGFVNMCMYICPRKNTINRYVERFRRAPPTSRASRDMPTNPFWWKLDDDSAGDTPKDTTTPDITPLDKVSLQFNVCTELLFVSLRTTPTLIPALRYQES